MHPGFYLKEEMDARGWIQRDLAFILGVPEQAINVILSAKRGISADMARALGEAFEVPAEFFANLHALGYFSSVHLRTRISTMNAVDV